MADAGHDPAANEDDRELADVVSERRRLLALAYRMLGRSARRRTAVQANYVRWYRMTDAERAAVANPQGWLTRAASRICLDLLGSARARRERYVGAWLPQPVPVDLHPLLIDDDGTARQAALEGGFHVFPPSYFVTGSLAGVPVPCVSLTAQRLFHTGYQPREIDLHDLAVLDKLDRGDSDALPRAP